MTLDFKNAGSSPLWQKVPPYDLLSGILFGYGEDPFIQKYKTKCLQILAEISDRNFTHKALSKFIQSAP